MWGCCWVYGDCFRMSRESGEISPIWLMLTTEAIISEIPEEKKNAPMPGGHGGGMEGMY